MSKKSGSFSKKRLKNKPVLLVDLDGTLINTPEIKRRLLKFLDELGAPSALLQEVRELFARFHKDKYRRLLASKDPQVRRVFKEYDRLLAARRNFNFPGVKGFLKRAGKTYELWLFSYGDPGIQAKKIRQAGIRKYFRKVVVTDDPTKERPLRKIMRLRAEVVLIDDSELACDAAGRCGVPAILVPKGEKDAAYFRKLHARLKIL